ncbi:hypothetical protein Ct61P_05065 [Colletotrichum tofieldiae]|nr:hypothetical protein Ct61P_05065 [Colletotrichum tofieldiae]
MSPVLLGLSTEERASLAEGPLNNLEATLLKTIKLCYSQISPATTLTPSAALFLPYINTIDDRVGLFSQWGVDSIVLEYGQRTGLETARSIDPKVIAKPAWATAVV